MRRFLQSSVLSLIKVLIVRGKQLMDTGDVVAARGMFLRAAEAEDPEAAGVRPKEPSCGTNDEDIHDGALPAYLARTPRRVLDLLGVARRRPLLEVVAT